MNGGVETPERRVRDGASTISTASRITDGVGGVTYSSSGDSCFKANVTVVMGLGVSRLPRPEWGS
jgi:hypothetical protein